MYIIRNILKICISFLFTLLIIALFLTNLNAQVLHEIKGLSEPVKFTIQPSEDLVYPSLMEIITYFDSLEVQAKLLPASSLSNLKEPPNFYLSEKIQLVKGRFMITGYSNIESEQPNIKVVVLSLKNFNKGNIKVPLDDIKLQRTNNIIIEPLYLRLIGKDQTRFYLKIIEGDIIIPLESGEEVNLIYLFKNAEIGDILEISERKSTKVW